MPVTPIAPIVKKYRPGPKSKKCPINVLPEDEIVAPQSFMNDPPKVSPWTGRIEPKPTDSYAAASLIKFGKVPNLLPKVATRTPENDSVAQTSTGSLECPICYQKFD